MKLPYAAEADAELSVRELEVLEEAYKKAAASHVQIPSQIKFNYAWGLVRSRFKNDKQKGVQLFHEIYKEDADSRRECLYYLALGYYRLGEYAESRRYNSMLLQTEPENMQAQSLQKLIREGVHKEGMTGLAILGGAVAVAGVLLAAFLKPKK